MKIISNGECYVQREDLEHLVENYENVPNHIYNSLKEICLTNADFIKIMDLESIDLIKLSDIPALQEYSSLGARNLRVMMQRIKYLVDNMAIDGPSTMSDEEIKELIQERKNREYMLKQIKQIFDYVTGKSKKEFPNVPKMDTEPIANSELVAYPSINHDKVVIFNLDGTRVENPEDKEFCEVAFKILTDKHELDENETLNMRYDGNYFVVETIKKKKSMQRVLNPAGQ